MPDTTLLLVTNYSRGSAGGGIKTYVEQLSSHLGHCGYRCHIIGRYGTAKTKDEKIIRGNTIKFIVLAWIRCFSIKPTIIHTHANWYCIVPALLYKMFSRVKIVHTMHSVPEKPYLQHIKLAFRWLLLRCDHVQFVSRFLRDYYAKVLKLPTSNCSVMYPGGDHYTEQISMNQVREFRKKFFVPDDAFLILSQGLTAHVLKFRGVVVLFEAFASLTVQFPNLFLVITKNGKYSEILRRRAVQLHLSDRIIFTGDLSEPAIANAAADIYAHITLGEGGVSLAVLEAMCCGNPIVAANVGGIPELLTQNETALLVHPEKQEVTDALKKLITDRQLRDKLGQNAQQAVHLGRQWKHTAEKHIQLYHSL